MSWIGNKLYRNIQLGSLNVQESIHIVQDYSLPSRIQSWSIKQDFCQPKRALVINLVIKLCIIISNMDTKPTYISSFETFLAQKTQENEGPQLSSSKHMVHILKNFNKLFKSYYIVFKSSQNKLALIRNQ